MRTMCKVTYSSSDNELALRVIQATIHVAVQDTYCQMLVPRPGFLIHQLLPDTKSSCRPLGTRMALPSSYFQSLRNSRASLPLKLDEALARRSPRVATF